ncbi:hypothetical protein V6N12_058395 [Hibiscus sabdariffa]|uniref:Uncharacterized protein n=1 Tax=Hibiscus sabdariffa TaxID=183260 RepID=A0ABR2ETW1_9ROSI
MEVLERCAIGWCRQPISNRMLAEEMKAAAIDDAHVMRISASLDRIEYRVDLKVREELFPVHVSEEKLFLWGPRLARVEQREGSSGDPRESSVRLEASAAGNSQAIEVEEENIVTQAPTKDAEGAALDESLRVIPGDSTHMVTTMMGWGMLGRRQCPWDQILR